MNQLFELADEIRRVESQTTDKEKDENLKEVLDGWKRIDSKPILRNRFGKMAWKLICVGPPESLDIEHANQHIDFLKNKLKSPRSPMEAEITQWKIDAIEGAIQRGEVPPDGQAQA